MSPPFGNLRFRNILGGRRRFRARSQARAESPDIHGMGSSMTLGHHLCDPALPPSTQDGTADQECKSDHHFQEFILHRVTNGNANDPSENKAHHQAPVLIEPRFAESQDKLNRRHDLKIATRRALSGAKRMKALIGDRASHRTITCGFERVGCAGAALVRAIVRAATAETNGLLAPYIRHGPGGTSRASTNLQSVMSVLAAPK